MNPQLRLSLVTHIYCQHILICALWPIYIVAVCFSFFATQILEAGTQPHGNIWKPFFRIKQKRGILSPTNVYKATTAVDLIRNLWEVYVHTCHITRSPEENPIGSPLFRKGRSSSLWSIEDAKTPRPKQVGKGTRDHR